MQNSDQTIVTKAHELLKSVIPMLNQFPRAHKYTLGDRIQNHLSDLLESLIRAYYSPTKEKRPLLVEANIKMEILRHYFRLGFELGLYNSNKLRTLTVDLNEIGRMTGGWIKSLSKS